MYTQDVADAICARLAEGESLRAICRDDGMPAASTVLAWLEDEDKAEFAEQYASARVRGYQLLADQIIEISDDECTMVRRSKHRPSGEDDEAAEVEVVFDPTAVARNRLRVDSRKWMLSKMLPKVYGDKVTTELTGSVKHDHSVGLSAETADLLASLKAGSGSAGDAAPVQE